MPQTTFAQRVRICDTLATGAGPAGNARERPLVDRHTTRERGARHRDPVERLWEAAAFPTRSAVWLNLLEKREAERAPAPRELAALILRRRWRWLCQEPNLLTARLTIRPQLSYFRLALAEPSSGGASVPE